MSCRIQSHQRIARAHLVEPREILKGISASPIAFSDFKIITSIKGCRDRGVDRGQTLTPSKQSSYICVWRVIQWNYCNALRSQELIILDYILIICLVLVLNFIFTKIFIYKAAVSETSYEIPLIILNVQSTKTKISRFYKLNSDLKSTKKDKNIIRIRLNLRRPKTRSKAKTQNINIHHRVIYLRLLVSFDYSNIKKFCSSIPILDKIIEFRHKQT